MRSKYCFSAFVIMFIFFQAKAQYAMFLKQGNITFERKVNTLALMEEKNKDGDNSWVQQYIDAYKKAGYQFTTTQFNLAFNGNKTLYTPVIDNTPKSGPNDWTSVANNNTVYTDLSKEESVALKTVFDDRFLVTDSTRKIHWKITDELRDIAGLPCRRANAIIMDSVYVVAFYTTEILTSGGPESFSGLPGMILGVALPHEHVTWFATKVSVNPPVTETQLVPPAEKRVKAVSKKEFLGELQNSLKDFWNKNAAPMIIQNAML